jgi:MSHA biogenesis protein MshJ
MKKAWQRLILKIDALNPRERGLVFIAGIALLAVFANTVFLNPLAAKQKKLSLQLRQAQGEIAGTETDIAQRLQLHKIDPDAADKVRLKQLQAQLATMRDALHKVEADLVASDKIATLLENVLKKNSRLHLLSLHTLSGSMMDANIAPNEASPIVGGNALAAKINAPAAVPAATTAAAGETVGSNKGPIFRHEVEIVVQANYLDLLDYMTELEKLPWRLYWGNVQLDVIDYPNATLTMTVFTLSLDPQWLHL